ncbi:MAG: type II toxin-antitoxin system HicA family toxin [Oscillospiraceae bacterium]|nr:type II toxin-antitoxin system HicA family toxin [Oscillospiraceae bacterium]
MKRKDLIKKLIQNGWYFKRDGGNHEIWTDGKNTEPIPRHKEINEQLAKYIIRKHGLK